MGVDGGGPVKFPAARAGAKGPVTRTMRIQTKGSGLATLLDLCKRVAEPILDAITVNKMGKNSSLQLPLENPKSSPDGPLAGKAFRGVRPSLAFDDDHGGPPVQPGSGGNGSA